MLEILFGWRKASKCKCLIGRVRSRLKLLRNKRDAIVRQLRQDVAQLLKNGQDQSAFSRVEQLFMDQCMLAAYDLLDHFCQFIIIHLPYIRKHRDCPNDINEAVSSLIFAGARCADLPELQTLRKLFGERYGHNFAEAAVELSPGTLVNWQISEKLTLKSISDDVKLRLIEEIARENDLQLKPADIKDGYKLKHQKVFDVSVSNSDSDWEEKVSERGISFLQSEAKSHGSLSNCTRPVGDPSPLHGSFDDTSNLINSAIVRQSTDIDQPYNSNLIHQSICDLETLNKKDPSYECGMLPDRSSVQDAHIQISLSTVSLQHKSESTISGTPSESSVHFPERSVVYLDDIDDFLPSMQDDRKINDGWLLMLKSMDVLLGDQSRKPRDKKQALENKPPQLKTSTEISRSQGDGKRVYGHDVIHRESCCGRSLKNSGISLSDLYRDDGAEKSMKFIELQNSKTNSGPSSKRRKSVRRTKKRSISGQNQFYKVNICEYNCEISDHQEMSRQLPRKIHSRRDSPPISGALITNDMDVLYYDEDCDDSDIDSVSFQRKTKGRHRTSPTGDFFCRKKQPQQISGEESRCSLIMCREKRASSPQPPYYYYSRKPPTELCCKGIGSNNHSSCKYNSRSYSRCISNHDAAADCSLEHPCYFFASDDNGHWSSSEQRNSAMMLVDCPSHDLRQQQMQGHWHCCLSRHEEAYDCSTTTPHKTSRGLIFCKPKSDNFTVITKERELSNMVLNIGMDPHKKVESRTCSPGSGTACDVTSQVQGSTRQSKKLTQYEEAFGRCDRKTSSHGSCSTEIVLQPSRPPTRPPYLRAVTMPPERPKIASTNEPLRSASFQYQLPNLTSCSSPHVHPKLPDYDDLAAKFTALKKVHLRSTNSQASNK